MPNLPPVSFHFKLSFKGEDAAFQEASGISKRLSVEEITSGGENRFKYRLPSIPAHENLVLRRPVVPSGSKLLRWCADSMDLGLVNPIKTEDITVSLLNENREISVEWTFFKAYPVSYSVSDLKSTENALAIETIELAFTYFAVTK